MAMDLVDWVDIHRLTELGGRRLLGFITRLRAAGVPVARIAGAYLVHMPAFRAFASKQSEHRRACYFDRRKGPVSATGVPAHV